MKIIRKTIITVAAVAIIGCANRHYDCPASGVISRMQLQKADSLKSFFVRQLIPDSALAFNQNAALKKPEYLNDLACEAQAYIDLIYKELRKTCPNHERINTYIKCAEIMLSSIEEFKREPESLRVAKQDALKHFNEGLKMARKITQ